MRKAKAWPDREREAALVDRHPGASLLGAREQGSKVGVRRRQSGERGAALVEFALVSVLFLTLLFGVMEAGWMFSQATEVRNAAREGGRLAVVDFGDATAIAAEVCERSSLSAAGTTVSIVRLPAGGPYESVQVTVSKTYDSLTGFLDPIFQGLDISSDVEMRIERELVNLSADGGAPCP